MKGNNNSNRRKRKMKRRAFCKMNLRLKKAGGVLPGLELEKRSGAEQRRSDKGARIGE